MSSKTVLFLAMMMVVLVLSIVFGFIVGGGDVNIGDTNRIFKYEKEDRVDLGESVVTPPTRDVQRVNPVNKSEVSLEYGYEIVPGKGYTDVVIEDAVVVKIQVEKDNTGFLVLEKNGVEMKLPMMGVVGIRRGDSGKSVATVVSGAGKVISQGSTVLRLRASFINDEVDLGQNEIVSHMEQKLSGMENEEVMMQANKTLGKKRLNDEEVVQRFNQDIVEFNADELLVISMTLK